MNPTLKRVLTVFSIFAASASVQAFAPPTTRRHSSTSMARSSISRQDLPVWKAAPLVAEHSSSLFATKDDKNAFSAKDPKQPQSDPSEKIIDVQAEEIAVEEISRVQKWRQSFMPQRLPKGQRDPDAKLPFRAKLAKMGMSVVLSYGWVSNVFMTFTVSAAWFIFSKRTGMSPLAPGQWKPFLGVYAGFWVANNFLRPFRVGISIAVSRYFDRFVEITQKRFKVSKGAAIGLTVFFANILGTCALLFTGISLASLLSGVPMWAR